MKPTLLSAAIACGLAGITSHHAAADSAKDLQKVASDLTQYADYTGPVSGEDASMLRDRRARSECKKIVGAAQKKLDPDAGVKSWAFSRHPKQQDNTVKVADLMWFCEEYDRTIDRGLLRALAMLGLMAKMNLEDGLNEHVKKSVEREQIEYYRASAKECRVLVDTVRAAGMADDAQIKTMRGDVKLAEMPALCDAIEKHADQLQPVFAEKFAKASAKYKAAGIGGKRLELFAYYEMEWYFPGCKSSTDDPKKLKAAKSLFQWLTGPDGVITIRKYSFRGDNYKITEKQFLSEKAAYGGCR